MSLGEYIAIEEEWNKYKERNCLVETSGSDAFDFIEQECAEVYPAEEEQDEIFGLISIIEESRMEEEVIG